MDRMVGKAVPPSRGKWAAPLLVVFFTVIAYSNTFNNPFTFDDINGIQNNPGIRSLVPGKFVASIPTTLSGRPVLAYSFAIDYAIGGTKVWIYHLTNVVIHALAGLLVYAIIRRSLLYTRFRIDGIAEYATPLAGIVAVLWTVHPLTTAAVTYTVQRAESLASVFILGSIYCVIRLAEGNKWWGLGAIAMCGLGMGSKETAAAAPLLALLYDRTFIAGSFREALKKRWKVYLGMAAMWAILLRAYFIDRHEGTGGFGIWISSMDYARTELNVIAHYLHQAFWPTDLTLDYSDWPIARSWSAVSASGWLVVALMVGTVIALWRKPWLGFLGAWFFLLLAPSSSIIPIGREAAADQRMYLPLAAVVCAVVVGAWIAINSARIMHWTAGAVVCVTAVQFMRMTIDRNGQYDSQLDIWGDTVSKRPYDTRARLNFGAAWMESSLGYPAGSPEALQAARQAQEQFRIVLEQDPNHQLDVITVGQSLEQSGNAAAAEEFYTDSLAKFPRSAAYVLVERGNLRARHGNWAGAEADYVEAMRENPINIEPHYQLGVMFQESGDWKKAESVFADIESISPGYKDCRARLEGIRKSERMKR